MAGRPPGEKSFANMVRIAVNEAGQTGQPKLRELADVLVTQALAGESWAMQQVADRLDGKPVQQNENNNTHEVGDTLAAFLKGISDRRRLIHDPKP